jgi:Ca2+/Na+ antiporter
LFSGLGSLEDAQETLSVGVGALAGSTIMLLTVPWALSVYAGRVDLNPDRGNRPDYFGSPKLTPKDSFFLDIETTGVTVTESVRHGGLIMAATTLPYFLIQVPALFLHGPNQEVAEGEHWWAFLGFVTCLAGLTYYMHLQLHNSQEGQDRDKRIAVMKKVLAKGEISLSGALAATIKEANEYEALHPSYGGLGVAGGGQYDSLSHNSLPGLGYPPPGVAKYLKEVLIDAFKVYDADRSGQLERAEIRMFFKDFHENISDDEMDKFLLQADTDGDGNVSFQEFIGLAYHLIVSHDSMSKSKAEVGTASSNTVLPRVSEARKEIIENIWQGEGDGESGEEEEEVPEEFTNLSPEEQQTAIKLKAFQMLALGTVMVIYFSDPMVDVMQEIAVRANLPPFYVSFVLAPLASNASEVVASMYYAAKKTRKTITVSLSALEGAACMNNTFWYVVVDVGILSTQRNRQTKSTYF